MRDAAYCSMHVHECTLRWVRVSRVPGAKESHIHEIYSGIALLEHLRTMTMHPDALLPARRAIRVMHRNAPGDDRPLTLSFSRNFFALLRKEGRTRDSWVLTAPSDRFYFESRSRKIVYLLYDFVLPRIF